MNLDLGVVRLDNAAFGRNSLKRCIAVEYPLFGEAGIRQAATEAAVGKLPECRFLLGLAVFSGIHDSIGMGKLAVVGVSPPWIRSGLPIWC